MSECVCVCVWGCVCVCVCVCVLPGQHVWPVRLCAQVAQAAQEASLNRINLLEELVKEKGQACAAAEAGRLQAVKRECGSISVRDDTFHKLKVPLPSHVCNNHTQSQPCHSAETRAYGTIWV